MKKLIVVNNPKQLQLQVEGVEVVSAKAYLTDPTFAVLKNVRVFNLCRSYSYQSRGYYVSLLAEARGHKPLPDVRHILDLRSPLLTRIVSDELDELVQQSLKPLKSTEFVLSMYFGQNVAKQYKKLAQEFHRLFPAPFLRAKFVFNKQWMLQSIKVISWQDIPQDHIPFIQQFAQEYFGKKRYDQPRPSKWQYDLAILHNPQEMAPPSNKKALQKFITIAEEMGFYTELIQSKDFHRLSSFDALFIRETTHVNNPSYRFARKAESEGLAVIDDPTSILKCSNKVYITELLEMAKVPTPKTLIVHKENQDQVVKQLGLPCVLKLPDSAFSLGVKKVSTPEQLKTTLAEMLETSELIIAQAFMPTDFDWRIGVLDGKPIYACQYFMARGHWQIYNWDAGKKREQFGDFATFTIEQAPVKIVEAAVKAANLIGRSLYGVDVKEIDGEPYIIEINDNPSIDAGVEDFVLQDELYKMIIKALKTRVEEKIATHGSH